MPTALLLIAHGSRNREANDDLLHVVAALRTRGSYAIVEASFLEIAEPDILTGGQKCVSLARTAWSCCPTFYRRVYTFARI